MGSADTYSVWYKDTLIASKMNLETALLLVEALFQKSWLEGSVSYIDNQVVCYGVTIKKDVEHQVEY